MIIPVLLCTAVYTFFFVRSYRQAKNLRRLQGTFRSSLNALHRIATKYQHQPHPPSDRGRIAYLLTMDDFHYNMHAIEEDIHELEEKIPGFFKWVKL